MASAAVRCGSSGSQRLGPAVRAVRPRPTAPGHALSTTRPADVGPIKPYLRGLSRPRPDRWRQYQPEVLHASPQDSRREEDSRIDDESDEEVGRKKFGSHADDQVDGDADDEAAEEEEVDWSDEEDDWSDDDPKLDHNKPSGRRPDTEVEAKRRRWSALTPPYPGMRQVEMPNNPTLAWACNPLAYNNPANIFRDMRFWPMPKPVEERRGGPYGVGAPIVPKPWLGQKVQKRTGVLAMKVCMMPIWDRWGVRHTVTVLYLDKVNVVQVKREETDGYNGLQIGIGERKVKNIPRPQLGHYLKAEVMPKRKLYEFKVSEDALLPRGTKLYAQHFVAGQLVDICGITKGKGTQGTMKLHHFKGQSASHGTSKTHRSAGSTGQCQDPGRTFKGKKMAGRMGCKKRTQQNNKILKIDTKNNLIFVLGTVVGNKGAVVKVTDAIKGAEYPADPPFPTFFREKGRKYPDELWHDRLDKDVKDPLAFEDGVEES